ncbi:MAG: TAXI family TRAP transporter solute-binding subunit [Gammaproteobacteria bacterium]
MNRVAIVFKRALITAFAVAQLVPFSAAATDQGGTLDGAIAGYSAGGMISVLGEGLTALVRNQYPGSSLTYEPGNPAGGLVKMVAGKRPFSMQTPLELSMAMAGDKPFRRAYNSDDFSVIGRVVDGMAVQIIMRAGFLRDHGISDLQGVADKRLPLRVSANLRGNLLGQVITERILKHYGLSLAQIVKQGGEVVHLPTRASAEMIRNRKLDMVVTAAFTPSSRLLEIATATDIELLSLPDELITALIKEFEFQAITVPATSYPFLDQDLPALATGFLLTAGSQTSFDDGYKMARSLHLQFDLLKGLHPAFARFSPEMLLKTGQFPLHAGAAAYYREAGLLVD